MSVEHVALRAPAPRATTVPCPLEIVLLLEAMLLEAIPVPCPLEIVLLLEAILLGGTSVLCELVGSELNLGTHRHRIGRNYG